MDRICILVLAEADNSTFTRGTIGVWTKADSITRFGNLTLLAR